MTGSKKRIASLQRVPKGQKHPYKLYENTPLWKAIDKAVSDLVENRDLVEDEYHEYIVGYICKVVNRPTKSLARNLIAPLFAGNRMDAFEAAKQVWNMDGNEIVNDLLRALRTGKRKFNRSAAAYALQAVRIAKVIPALEKTVRNKSENPEVRGQAIESLAHYHRKSTHDLLIKTLQDPNRDVRFWCAFALGQMHERKALPDLKLLLHDQRLVRGFHSVANEARDSIESIERRESKGRCSYCV